VAVIAPILGGEIGLPREFASFYATSIFLTAAVAVLPSPMLVARYGAIRVSQVSLLFAAFGLIVLTTTPGGLLALSAAAIGIAYAPTNPASSHLLARHTPLRLRARIFSLKQMSVPIGSVVAALAIPFVAERLGWRVAILMTAAVCLAGVLLVELLRVKLDVDRDRTLRLAMEAMLDPLRMLGKDRKLATLAAGSAMFIALQFTFSAMFVTVIVTQMSYSLPVADQTLAIGTGAGMFAQPLWGWLADRIGSARVLALVGVAMGSAAIMIALITPDWPNVGIVALSIVFGATAMGWNGVYLAEVARAYSGYDVARATAATMFVTYLGALGGPLAYGLMARASGSLTVGFVALGVVAIAGGLMFLMRRPHGLN
jgi:MFS family permease